ncbi:hypothetical protein ABGB12_34325 [Actinocorallia sp. B10E7]|uniref:hypothetical protein n=1 Tax=Actinocorallia sp. B10E7 TaxID=3153558 RepID=UPI00325CA877
MWRRIRWDLPRRRDLEARMVTGVALLFAVLSLFGDLVSTDMQLAVCTVGIGLLVHRLTPREPEPRLCAREELLRADVYERLRSAREVWMFAPSGQNFLSAVNRATLREHVLARERGVLRAVVLDPELPATVETAARHLSGDHPTMPFPEALCWAYAELSELCAGGTMGRGEVRLLGFNPGFSIVAIDPSSRKGMLIVEFHGFHNPSSAARMHLRLTSADGDWYRYWLGQFEQLWEATGTAGSPCTTLRE